MFKSTSGMKATLNGIPNLSALDGWWEEGCQDGINGWAVGNSNNPDDKKDADHLYSLLEERVIPTFYDDRKKWINIDRWLSNIEETPGWKHPYDLMPGNPADRL